MTKLHLLLAAGSCVVALGAWPALAADVRSQLTPELIYEHCQAAGLGSEAEGTVMLPEGRRISGTVLCTAEDLVAPKITGPRRHHDDDEDEDEDHDRRSHDEGEDD
jgi:hypothetical protein